MLGRLVVAHYDMKMVFKTLFVAPLIILVLFLVSSYFLAMPLGLTLFFFTPNGTTVGEQYYYFRMELFMVYDFYLPVALNAGQVFLFLWGVFLICFVAAWRFRENLHEVIRKGFSRPLSKLFNNNLLAMPIISSMLLIAVVAIHSFQESYGVPTGSLPEMDPFELLLSLTYSSLIEEISFRISAIGVFLIAYLFWMGRDRVATWSGGQALKVALLIPLYPEKAKRLLGVKTVSEFGIRGISLTEWIMIIITSLAFGLIHWLSGWGPGKITTVTLQASAFGLAYLIYGAQASILLHWFFNYYWYSYVLALDFYPTVLPIVFLIDLVTLILGVVGWSMFAVLLGVWVHRRWKGGVAPLPPSPTQLPPSTPPPPIIRFCRQCGRVLSEDVKFCPYCGKAFEEERKEEA